MIICVHAHADLSNDDHIAIISSAMKYSLKIGF